MKSITANVCLFNNGTLALQIGLQGMGISGEVITPPFTFVATSHALYWNKIRPIFVDIEPDYYTLDPADVEAAITPWTSAILAVHVYDFTCHLNALADIARRHKLALIYDVAHACGVTVGGRPINQPFRRNDASLLSDPFDSNMLAGNLLEVLLSDSNYNYYRKAGLERSKLFSWSIVANKTINILKEVC